MSLFFNNLFCFLEMISKIKIFIAYTEKLIYEGLHSLIDTRKEYSIVGSDVNGENIIHSLKKVKFDILIIELGFPNKCNLKYVSRIKLSFPEIKILMITSYFKQGIVNKFIDLGIDGYILKKCTSDDLFSSLEKIIDDENYFCSAITQLLLKEYQDVHENKEHFLTYREIEITRLLIEGLSNEEIAQKLSISLHTVKTHRKNIMDKFGAKNLISLIRYACRENLIERENDFFCVSCPYKLATNL